MLTLESCERSSSVDTVLRNRKGRIVVPIIISLLFIGICINIVIDTQEKLSDCDCKSLSIDNDRNVHWIDTNWIGTVIPRNPNDVVIQDDILYVSTESGLLIFNVSDPNQPIEIGFFGIPGVGVNLVIKNQYVFLLERGNIDSRGGIWIINVSVPSNPFEVTFFEIRDYSNSLTTENEYLYVVGDNIGLIIIDISDPENLVIIGTLNQKIYSKKIVVQNDIAYIADYKKGFLIIDVVHKEKPRIISEYLLTSVLSFELVGTYVYITTEGNDFRIINISNIAVPTEEKIIQLPYRERSKEIAYENEKIFVLTTGAINIYDAVEINSPTFYHSIKNIDEIYDIDDFLINNYTMYLTNQDRNSNGVEFISFSNDYLSMNTTKYSTNGLARNIYLSGDYVFVNDVFGVGIRIFNISNPHKPIEIKNININIADINIVDNYLFLTAGENGFHIYNISDINKIIEISNISMNGFQLGFDVNGDIAYIAGTEGLTLVNISNIDSPAEIKTIKSNLSYATDIYISDDYAYVSDGDDGFAIFDVSQPYQPLEIVYYKTGSSNRKMVVQDNYIFLVDAYSFQIINITDKTNPILMSKYAGLKYTKSVSIMEQYAFILMDSSPGLIILDITDYYDPVEAGKYKNIAFASMNDMIVDKEYVFFTNEKSMQIIHFNVTNNYRPKAKISNILPCPALKGKKVDFFGQASDIDGNIISYKWYSNLDGDLSYSKNFSTVNLSTGNHVIEFSVIDNEGASSSIVCYRVVICVPSDTYPISNLNFVNVFIILIITRYYQKLNNFSRQKYNH